MGILKLESFQWLMCVGGRYFTLAMFMVENVESCEICACMAISRGSFPSPFP
jgi:hypothetical protein